MDKRLINKFITGRVTLVILTLIYLIAFDWMYISWLAVKFTYLGFEYHEPGLLLFLVSHIIAWLPALWIPLRLIRPSVIIYWFLFLMTYIPAVLLPVYIRLSSVDDLYFLMLSLLAGMIIIGAIYFIPVLKLPSLALSEEKFLKIMYIVTGLLALYIIYVFKGRMRLVGLDDIYELRKDNDELLEGSMVGYAILAMGACFFPMLLALGLTCKNYRMLLSGALGLIFLYSTQGSKTYLFSSVILVMVYLIIRKNSNNFGLKLIVFFIILTVVLNALTLYGPQNWLLITSTIASITFMRTICMGGMLTSQYYFFFTYHPKTYYSHINVVRKVIDYPYGNQPLGRVIGYSFTGDTFLNANANFWVTDGIAATGVIGVIIISLLCAIVFWFLDSVAKKHNVIFASLCIVVISMALLNTSLFTTLLSGGLGLMIVMLFLKPAGQQH